MDKKELLEYTFQKIGSHIATRAVPARLNNDPEFDPEKAAQICHWLYRLGGCDQALYDKAVNDFIDYSLEFLKLQAELESAQRYHFSSYKKLQEEIYENPEVMENRYLNGLYLTQALWINHHKMLAFFIKKFCSGLDVQGKAVEVPVGTGIYAAEFAARNKDWLVEGYDLSPSAVDYSKKMIPIISPDKEVAVFEKNVFDLPDDKKYDRIICGELMENFEDPHPLLEKLGKLLNEEGKIFLTSSVWAAAIDHIYLFTKVQELRDVLSSHFKIEEELALNVFQNKKPEDEKTPINYACILSRRSEEPSQD
ncbi:hypothetical protein COV20_04045 [Candidatus Woesearchaeota archaeon CG10_big_fil_rev_8_21_14_0_10_45_16]|nr:MAG: hypothetical protein COV20_04045 [Candidatus Woesearchaeota archaeon CG10_big_fil_rev_8_21_14_0_10_45_16]